MTTVLVVFINVVFIVFVYVVFSRRLSKMEKQSIPEKMQEAMDSLLADFNRAAARNIDLIEDRIKSLKEQTAEAEKAGIRLEGILNRAEALERRMESQNSLQQKPVPVPDSSEVDTAALHKRSAAKAYGRDTPPGEEKESLKSAPKKRKSGKKRKPGIRQLKQMAENGASAEEIAAEFGISREEVVLKLRFHEK